jgi:hypothetical protein
MLKTKQSARIKMFSLLTGVMSLTSCCIFNINCIESTDYKDFQSFRSTLNSPGIATDIWKIPCPSPTAYLKAQVSKLDRNSRSTVSLFLSKNSTSSSPVSDSIADLSFSDWTSLPYGAGDYILTVSKTSANVPTEGYDVNYTCNAKKGDIRVKSGSIKSIQDQ